MSSYALLVGVRDYLRQNFPLANVECDCLPDGQPLPSVGNRFLALHLGSDESGGANPDRGIACRYSLLVTLTMRSTIFPKDREKNLWLLAVDSMESQCERIRDLIHQNYELQVKINQILQAREGRITGRQGFFDPLVWSSTDAAPTPRYGDWFWSTSEHDHNRVVGYSMNVLFSNAMRIKTIEEIDEDI